MNGVIIEFVSEIRIRERDRTAKDPFVVERLECRACGQAAVSGIRVDKERGRLQTVPYQRVGF